MMRKMSSIFVSFFNHIVSHLPYYLVLLAISLYFGGGMFLFLADRNNIYFRIRYFFVFHLLFLVVVFGLGIFILRVQKLRSLPKLSLETKYYASFIMEGLGILFLSLFTKSHIAIILTIVLIGVTFFSLFFSREKKVSITQKDFMKPYFAIESISIVLLAFAFNIKILTGIGPAYVGSVSSVVSLSLLFGLILCVLFSHTKENNTYSIDQRAWLLLIIALDIIIVFIAVFSIGVTPLEILDTYKYLIIIEALLFLLLLVSLLYEGRIQKQLTRMTTKLIDLLNDIGVSTNGQREFVLFGLLGFLIGLILYILWGFSGENFLGPSFLLWKIGFGVIIGKFLGIICDSEWFKYSASLKKIIKSHFPSLSILLLSFCVGSLVFIFSSPFFGGDSSQYIMNARILANMASSAEVGSVRYNPPGYPFLLWLTGAASQTHFLSLFLLQTVMASFMPLLIYKLLKELLPGIAFIGAIISILSIIPFSFLKAVMTETPYMFFLLLTVLMAIKFIKSDKLVYMYLSIILTIVLLNIRVSANAIFMIFIVLFFIYKPSRFIHYVISLAIIFSATYTIPLITAKNYNINSSSGTYTSKFGRAFFYSFYVGTAKFVDEGEQPIYSPGTGESNAYLYELIKEYVEEDERYDEYINNLRDSNFPDVEEYFFMYEGDVDQLIEAMYTKPSRTYIYFIDEVLGNMLTAEERNSLMMNATLEGFKHSPELLIKKILFDFKSYYIGPPYQFSDEASELFHFKPFHLVFVGDKSALAKLDLISNALDQAQPDNSGFSQILQKFLNNWVLSFRYFRIAIFIGEVILVFYLWKKPKPYIFSVLLCFGILFYSSLIIALFNTPRSIYVFQAFLLEVILGIMGYYYLWQTLGRGFEIFEKKRQSV